MRSRRIFVFLISLFAFSELSACTGLLVKAKDGSTVNGRTVEFATDLDMTVAVIPRGFSFTGNVPGGPGMTYRSKYTAVGIYCFEDKVLMDGINEKGLVAAAFYFPGYAHYTSITQANREKALSPVEFPNWILTQFASIEELKIALKSVVIAPTVIKNWGTTPPPMHYIVYDRTGQSLVIEPVEGTLKIYDNPLGTITNSPGFEWHMQNLNNYAHLTPFNASPTRLGSMQLRPFGQGSGMTGLPGDFSPPSRFIRAALFSTFAIPTEHAQGLVNQAFHLLNQFDIPLGSVRESEQGKTHDDYTQITTVKDPQSLRYYYRSYADQQIKFVDLKQRHGHAQTIQSLKIIGAGESLDVSASLR